MLHTIKEAMSTRQEEFVNHWKSVEGNFIDTGDDRDLRYVNSEIDRIIRSLSLDERVSELANQLYTTAKENGMIRGRSIDEVIAASLYIACRQLETGRSIDDISQVTTVERNTISRTTSQLSKELGIQVEIASPSEYVDRFVTKTNKIRTKQGETPFGDDVNERAHSLISLSEETGLVSGKSPSGFAAAAIYLAAKQLDYTKVRQSDLAEVADVNEVTIRQRYQEQEELWNNRK